MGRHRISRFGTLGLILGCLAAGVYGQETLRVYGPLSVSPAIEEAGVAFRTQQNVVIEIVAGPTDEWLEQARRDADLIYSSAEFMMSQFCREHNLAIVEDSVTPLYLRPSAILVRLGNPRAIHDLADLAKPGVNVMVVTGSGQTGLWEDMAGKMGDVRLLRALRRNIIYFAPHSENAVRTWDERPEIDAWITWNIWHVPLRNRATLVPVSPEYVVYRHSSIALTERGKTRPVAARFIEFLTSPEGQRIFESWGWLPPASELERPAIQRDISIVVRIRSDEWIGGIGAGLAHLRDLVQDYQSMGIPSSEVHVSAVLHGEAVYWALKDVPYRAFKDAPAGNPNKAIMKELSDLGVSVEVCERSLGEHNWSRQDVLPEVRVVHSAFTRIVDLELQGYAYLRF